MKTKPLSNQHKLFPYILFATGSRESALYPRPEETGLYGAAGKEHSVTVVSKALRLNHSDLKQ